MEDGDMHSEVTRREAGFSLIEILIAMAIMIIMVAIAIPTFLGTRNNASHAQFIGAARSYAGAVEAYRLDHAGQAPRFGSADWPAATPADAAKGPINGMAGLNPKNVHYLHSGVPEALVDGKVTIDDQPAAPKSYHIQYIRDTVGGSTYSIIVSMKDEKFTCSIGTLASTVKACG
jgi:prepilin-type N-terminal cleavage/methylation domain-containing protein